MADLQIPAATSGTDGWWPSRYGAGDQAGALNEITPGKGCARRRGSCGEGKVSDLAYTNRLGIEAIPAMLSSRPPR